MSHEEKNNKIKLSHSISTISLMALCFLNLSGLGYLAFQENQNKLKDQKQLFDFKTSILQTKQQIKEVSQTQTQFQQQTTSLIQQLGQRHHRKPSIYHLKWLLQQAKWQTNILYQTKTSQQLLELAKKIAEKKHLGSLEEAIQNDINQLTQLGLTDNATLVTQISQLQLNLAKLHPTETFIKTDKATTNELPSYLKTLQPFVQIEKIKQSNITVVPPASQFQVIENMQLLLPQIQYAGISHQQDLFNALTTQLANQWQLVNNYFNDASINQQIEELKTDKFQLEKPMRFESTSEIHLLIKQLNKSNP